MFALTDCDGAAEWSEAKHAQYVLQNQPDDVDRMSTLGLPVSRVCAGFLPRCCTGETQVWQGWFHPNNSPLSLN